MGVSTTITVTCDYSGCAAGPNGKAVVSWNKELADSGQTHPPEEAKYLVLFQQNGGTKAFCCQLHAAAYFLPPGYEATQKPVVEFPSTNPQPETTVASDWKDEPYRRENPDNGQEEK